MPNRCSGDTHQTPVSDLQKSGYFLYSYAQMTRMNTVKTPRVASPKRLAHIIAFIAIAAGSSYAHAKDENECGTRAQQIIQQAYPQAQTTHENTFLVDGATTMLPTSKYLYDNPQAMVCKQWPSDPGKLLVAVPLIRKSDPDGYFHEGDLDILVLDNNTLRVLQRLRAKNLMSDDAISITNVQFDTARYHLAPGKTAFGVRIDTKGASSVNPYDASTLRLYAIEKEKLIPILDNIVVSQSNGEWNGRCEGEFRDITRVLSMTPDTRHDWAAITVKETTTSYTTDVTPDGSCEESKSKKGTSKTTLTRNGDMYPVPPQMKLD